MRGEATISYAGFWKRIKAFAFDYLVILIYLMGLTGIFMVINQTSNFAQRLFASRISAQVSGFLLVTLPISLYFAMSESSKHRATWGKQRLRLSVTDQNGHQIGFPRSLTRTLLKFVPWELSHTILWENYFYPETASRLMAYGFTLVYFLLGLNLASLAFTKSHRTLYDYMAGTIVVEKNGI